MKRILILLIIAAMTCAAQAKVDLVTLPTRDTVQLTIYNSADMTLVRERRALTLKEGKNNLQFSWENTLIDPTSLEMLPKANADQIDIADLSFPPRVRNLGLWNIQSGVSGKVPVEITYLTSGLSWRAFYMGTLTENEDIMHLQGYVRVTNNSGEDYENAQTRLIVGQVHMLDYIEILADRDYPYDRPAEKIHIDLDLEGYTEEDKFLLKKELSKIMRNAPRQKQIAKEGLSEYFLYTIEGTETIPDGWGKRLLSFEADDIEIESLYKYDENRWGNQTIRFVKFANDTEHNLGKTPIPDGNVKIYSLTNEQGYLSYVGGTNIKYIPVNEEVELNLGPARLVEIEPVLMDFKTANYLFDPNENITGWDEIRSWKIDITNTRTLPVEIEITRDFGTAYWTLESQTLYEKHDITRARFNLDIEPRTKSSFEYTVTTYHGMRQEQINQ
ncbi:MAG: hypothetical protein JW715_16410 [Sedimentisphaerales bacterium]|nr:hypothetical protein [Sedimentisphaerales bacterium]